MIRTILDLFERWDSATATFHRELLRTGNPFSAVKQAIQGWKDVDYTYSDLLEEYGIESKLASVAASIAGDPLTYLAIPKIGKVVAGGVGAIIKGGHKVMKFAGGKAYEKIMSSEIGKSLAPTYLNLVGIIDRMRPIQYIEEGLGTQVYNILREGVIAENLDKMRTSTKLYELIAKYGKDSDEVMSFIDDFYKQAASVLKLKGIPDDVKKMKINILSIEEDNPLYTEFYNRIVANADKLKLKYVEDYSPRIYKQIKIDKELVKVKDLAETPSIFVSMPSQFHPFFLNPRIIKDPEKGDLISDKILAFLKYVNDFYIKVYREPSYFIARAEIKNIHNTAKKLLNEGKEIEAGKLLSKARVLENVFLAAQGKLPGDKFVEKFAHSMTSLVHAGALGGVGSPLKNLSQFTFSWTVIGDYIFKGIRQYFTSEGKEILKSVQHIFTDWKQEFADIYKVAYESKIPLNKAREMLHINNVSPSELSPVEKMLVRKLLTGEGGVLQKIVSKSLFLFRKAEEFLRGATFLGARQRFLDYAEKGKVEELFKEVRKSYVNSVRKAYEDGKIELAASKYADDIVGMTQYRYGVLDTPNLLRSPSGRILLQFQSYPLNTVFMISRMMENDMYENVAKLIGFGFYALNLGQKAKLNLREFTFYGMLPQEGMIAPIPAFLWHLHKFAFNREDEHSLYQIKRLAFLFIPWGRFSRKFGYAFETWKEAHETGEYVLRDEFERISRRVSFPETVAYLFDLPTVSATKWRTDFRALNRAKARYNKILDKLKGLHREGNFAEIQRIKEETGIYLTDRQIENIRATEEMDSFERAIYYSPRTKEGFKKLLRKDLRISEEDLEELLNQVKLSYKK